MIKFALRCEADHAFDSWFRDNRSFDDLAKAGHLACPTCGSSRVAKALMAPAIVTGRQRIAREPAAAAAPSPEPTPPPPVAVTDERATALRAALKDMREHLERHSKNVGPQFATEARRMHEGQSDRAAIHGQASSDEVRALLDDGIEVMPLPVFPDERN